MANNDNIIDDIFSDAQQSTRNMLSVLSFLKQSGVILAFILVTVILFVILRPNNGSIYARKYKNSMGEKRAPRLKKGGLEFVKTVYGINKREMREVIGFEGYMFLRFMKLCAVFIGFTAFFGAFVIIPINYTQGNNVNVAKDGFSGFRCLYFTMYHIINLDWYLVHIGFTYVFTLVFFFLVYRGMKEYKEMELEYYGSIQNQKKVSSRSLMITNIPEELQSDRKLREYIMMHTKQNVELVGVNVVRNLGMLPQMVKEQEQGVRELEKALQKYMLKRKVDNTAKRPMVSEKGVKVDKIEKYERELRALELAITVGREKVEEFKETNMGFLVYGSPQEAREARRILKRTGSSIRRGMYFYEAPAPKDVQWENAMMSPGDRFRRRWFYRAVSFVLILLSFIPTTTIASISSVDNLSKFFPNLKLYNSQAFAYLWQYVVTPWLLIAYALIVPIILRWLGRKQGIITKSGIERSVFKKLYVFYILSNIIVFTLTNTVMKMVKNGETPQTAVLSMPMTLISIINTNSQFWATYIVLKAISTAFAVIHPVSILKIYFHRYLRTLTPRELYDLTFPQEQQLAPIYAFYTWLFTLCMLYCVYSPLISIIGVILFYFGYAVYKYNFLYVNYCRQMNAPSMFILAINRMFFALIFSQIYITLAMYIRYGEFGMTRTPAFFTAPLPFITLIVRAIYSYVFSSKRYSMVSQPEASSLRIDPKTDQTRYLHPILSSSLLIPVVSSKFESLLPLVYSGKIQYFYGKSVNEDANMTENEPIKLSIMNHSHSYTQSNDNLLYSAYTPAADQNRYHHNLFANPFNDNVSEYAGSELEFSSTYPPNQVHRNSPPLNCSPTHSNHNNGYYNNYNEHNADYNSTSYDNPSNTYQNLHNNDYNHHNNYYNNNDSTNRYNKSNAIHTSSTNGFNGYANNNNPYSEHAPSPYPNDYPKNYNQHN